MDFCPKAFVIDYSDIINNMMVRFIEEHQDLFTRYNQDNGQVLYVFSGKLMKTRLSKIFSEYLSDEIDSIHREITDKFSKTFSTRHIYIIYGCSPGNNVLADDCMVFPEDRFSINEADIKIDFMNLEFVWNELFQRRIKMKNHGIMFVPNCRLNFQQMSNILTQIYGSIMLPYVRHGNLIEDVSNKVKFHFDGKMTSELKIVIEEVKDYVRERQRNNG